MYQMTMPPPLPCPWLQLDAALELDSILEAYAARNVTTRYTNDYPVWKVRPPWQLRRPTALCSSVVYSAT
jgi:hypothetical protein